MLARVGGITGGTRHLDQSLLAGATGWAGSELARGIARTADLALVAAVARRHAGQSLDDVLHEPRLTSPVHGTVAEALATPCDIFLEYTKPDSAWSRTGAPGSVRGSGTSRSLEAFEVRVRMVLCSPGHQADHSCSRGQALLVLEGELVTELRDGCVVTLTAGTAGRA